LVSWLFSTSGVPLVPLTETMWLTKHAVGGARFLLEDHGSRAAPEFLRAKTEYTLALVGAMVLSDGANLCLLGATKPED